MDIHNQRLSTMDATGVDFMVLSCAQPCIQGISDPELAATTATNLNNELAEAISNNTLRFGAFAALSMHNASVAAAELKRAVQDLGFIGALVNDYQQSGPDNDTLLFYDTPDFDDFWQAVEDLDVPVYFHPRNNIKEIQDLSYGHSPWLFGPGQEFTATLSTHLLGLCANGVFDRFPSVQVIAGHLGERIPSDLFRIDHQLARQLPSGMPMLRNASDYWQTNLLETTSGNFATDLLLFHIQEIGLDRIMYSVDYPFVAMQDGAAWLDTLNSTLNSSSPLNQEDFLALKRQRTIEVLKLND